MTQLGRRAVEFRSGRFRQRLFIEGKAALLDRGSQRVVKRLLHVAQANAILRTFRSGQARFNRAQIEFDRVGENRVRGGIRSEQPLFFSVPLHQIHQLGRPAAQLEVAERLIVDREKAHRRSVLRRHVGQRRAIRQGHLGQSRAEELDKLADHTLGPQNLRDRQHQIRRRRSFRNAPDEFESDHFRGEHVDRLAEHHGFGLDPADAPTDHAQPVDHCRVAVRADQAVRKRHRRARLVARQHHPGQILEIHLVHDPRRRRDHAEVVEGLLGPLQTRVALRVPLELLGLVDGQRVGRGEGVHLHRMVDHQIARHLWVDALRIAAQPMHGRPQRREVHHARHAGEILQHDPPRFERHLHRRRLRRVPLGQAHDVVPRHLKPVRVPQRAFQEHFNRKREPIVRQDPVLGQLGQPMDRDRPPLGLQRRHRPERIRRRR